MEGSELLPTVVSSHDDRRIRECETSRALAISMIAQPEMTCNHTLYPNLKSHHPDLLAGNYSGYTNFSRNTPITADYASSRAIEI